MVQLLIIVDEQLAHIPLGTGADLTPVEDHLGVWLFVVLVQLFQDLSQSNGGLSGANQHISCFIVDLFQTLPSHELCLGIFVSPGDHMMQAPSLLLLLVELRVERVDLLR